MFREAQSIEQPFTGVTREQLLKIFFLGLCEIRKTLPDGHGYVLCF